MMEKYEYEEFLSRVKKEMDCQEKVISPINGSAVDVMYHLLSPYPSSFFIDNAVEIDKKYSMYLWDKNFDQIKNLFPDLEMDLIMDYVKYVRTKFIYDELERVKSRSLEDECTFFVYADSGESFVFEEPSYSCSKIFLQVNWVEDEETFYFRILPSAMGFFSYQVKEEEVFPKKVSSKPLTFHEIRILSGLTQKEFSERYNIPKRSIENWDAGSRNPPDYLVELLERIVKEDIKKESR